MNKLIILLPALFIAGSISSVNATDDNINKINITEDNHNLKLPTDEKGIHDFICDKEKFKANKEKIFDYMLNMIHSYESEEDQLVCSLYYQEIMKLMIQEKSDGHDDLIDQFAIDSKFMEVIACGIAYEFDFDYCRDTTIKSMDNNNLPNNDKEAKEFISNIFDNLYTLLRYIITESSIKNDSERVDQYIEKMFSTLFTEYVNSSLPERSNTCNDMYDRWISMIFDFYEKDIVSEVKSDKENGILVLQRILEYLHQYFYEPYKEFINNNNNLDINKSNQFKTFVGKMFWNYNKVMDVREDTENYYGSTYGTLLMLLIYNKLGMSLVANKLYQSLKHDKSYEHENFDKLYDALLYCNYKPEHVKKLFDMILELQKDPNNNTNKMLMSFYVKALFMKIYDIYDDKNNNTIDIISNLFKEEKYRNIYILLNNYQMNCSTICNKNSLSENDKRLVYYLTESEFRKESAQDYIIDDSNGYSGTHTVYYNNKRKLWVDKIKLLLNFFDKIRYERVPSLYKGYRIDKIIMLPRTYTQLISERIQYMKLNTKCYSL